MDQNDRITGTPRTRSVVVDPLAVEVDEFSAHRKENGQGPMARATRLVVLEPPRFTSGRETTT